MEGLLLHAFMPSVRPLGLVPARRTGVIFSAVQATIWGRLFFVKKNSSAPQPLDFKIKDNILGHNYKHKKRTGHQKALHPTA